MFWSGGGALGNNPLWPPRQQPWCGRSFKRRRIYRARLQPTVSVPTPASRAGSPLVGSVVGIRRLPADRSSVTPFCLLIRLHEEKAAYNVVTKLGGWKHAVK